MSQQVGPAASSPRAQAFTPSLLRAGTVLLGLFLVIEPAHADVPPPIQAGLESPVFFTANEGQFDPEVLFLARWPNLTAFFTRSGVVYSFSGRVLRSEFLNSAPAAQVVGEDLLPHSSHHYVGRDPARWREGVRHFGKIRYHDVYQGVDIIYSCRTNGLKYDFVVRPGADPKQIRVAYDGATSLGMDADGALVIRSGDVVLRDLAPISYQDTCGGRKAVRTSYSLGDDDTVGFTFWESWDQDQLLTIDPYLLYSTYLGGTLDDYAYGVATDSSSNAYVTGWTASTNFPKTNSSTNQGERDVFVSKYSSSGSYLFGTYIGGTGTDEGWAIDVDSSGRAHVVGHTESSNFPVLNAADSSYGGWIDAFVFKMNTNGTLSWSTYWGGASTDEGYGIAVQKSGTDSGSVYITGLTYVNDPVVFPLQDPFQDEHVAGGGTDLFIAKFTSAGANRYSSLIATAGLDSTYAIAVDDLGRAYVAAGVGEADFVDADAADPDFTDPNPTGVYPEGLVIRFEAHTIGQPLEKDYATYIGGTNTDAEYPQAIVVLSDYSAIVTGYTPATDFPTTSGAYDTTLNGVYDVTVTKIASNGKSFVFSTYLGGTGDSSRCEVGKGIAVDSQGKVWVGGYTCSASFPMKEAIDDSYGGGTDGFLAQLSSNGSQLLFSTYVGGGSEDKVAAISRDPQNRVLAVGVTESTTEFPIYQANDGTHNGGDDAFVMKVSVATPLFIRGDVDGDGDVDSQDSTALGNIFGAHNPGAVCLDAADVNDSGTIDVTDVQRLSSFLSTGSPAPSAPHPSAGTDPTSDTLGCFKSQ